MALNALISKRRTKASLNCLGKCAKFAKHAKSMKKWKKEETRADSRQNAVKINENDKNNDFATFWRKKILFAPAQSQLLHGAKCDRRLFR